jgi:hypothetical protein
MAEWLNTRRSSWWQIGFDDGIAGKKTAHMMALPGYENGYFAGAKKRADAPGHGVKADDLPSRGIVGAPAGGVNGGTDA